jgi:hypothetical protein
MAIDGSIAGETIGLKRKRGIIPDHYHRPRSRHRRDLRMQQYRLLKGPRIYFGSQLSVAMTMTSQKTKCIMNLITPMA